MKKALGFLLALWFCAAGYTFAQTITGSITGTVTDPSGAVVPGVKVVATNTGTNGTFNAISNEAGIYNLVFLPVGSYTLEAELQGFKKVALAPFRLEVNQIARLDIKLEVGSTAQTVEITAAAPIIQTESTATGDTVTSTDLTAIPLNGRNFATVTLLIPGAISTAPNSMNTSGRFQGSGSRPQVNGNREQTNNFLLDGVDVNDSIDNRVGYQPNVDALEEVKVITGNGGGEFGNVGGAIVNMTIKGGTNNFHGNVFEFLRNEKLDANGFFRNRSAATAVRAPFKRNIFGGTFGGPIIKNKLFFFIDYEGTEQRGAGTGTASVAPAAWRTGNLSDFLKTGQIVKDPLTGQPFTGNIIPSSRIVNPAAKYLFAHPELYPLPNATGTGSLGVTGNYAAGTASLLRNHQGDAKIDYRFSDKDLFFARFSSAYYLSYSSRTVLPVLMTSGTEGPSLSTQIGWTRTFSPRVVNDTRVAYSRIGIDDSVYDWSGLLGSDGNSKFGIAGGQPIPGLSSIIVGGGLSSVGTGASIGSTMDNKYQFNDTLTYSKGAHLLKMGGQLLRMQQNRYYAGNNGALGIFTYNGSYTGLDYADFLLNQLAIKGRGVVTGKWGHRQWRNGFFFQDDWKAKRNLTINLGLRWEYVTPIYEVADRQVNINTYTGELLYPGKSSYGRALYNPYWKQFMPRVGAAWTPEMFKNKLVVRAGYAFTSFLEGTGANLRLPMNPPFASESNINYGAGAPGDIGIGFSDVPPGLTFVSPGVTAYSMQGRAWDLNLRPQFTSQYNFTLEYQVTHNTSASVAYVGQKGTHLVVPHEANQPLPGSGDPKTWTALNTRRPLAKVLPNLGNIALTESSGTMAYNALQTSIRHRLSKGFELMGHYTFSKTLTDNLGYYGCGSVNSDGAYWQNAYDRHANYGPACFDATHNLALGGLATLPIGKGQAFGANAGKAFDLILGGWNINYMVSTHSGFPVTITDSAWQTNTLQSVRGNVRANRYRKMNVSAQTVDRYFGPVDSTTFCASGVDNGTCAYGIPALGSFGNAPVGAERAPSFFDLDLSIGKKFHMTESKYVDFRAEFFNAFNHVSFGPPGRDISTLSTFGSITGQVTPVRNIQFGLKYVF
jgi:hypothetical protein